MPGHQTKTKEEIEEHDRPDVIEINNSIFTDQQVSSETSTANEHEHNLQVIDSSGQQLSGPGQIIGCDGQGNEIFQDSDGKRFLILDGTRTSFQQDLTSNDIQSGWVGALEQAIMDEKENKNILMENNGSIFVLKEDEAQCQLKSTATIPEEALLLAQTSGGGLLYQTKNGDIYLIRSTPNNVNTY